VRAIQPPSVVLLGPTGSGKTDSVASFIEAGVEVFFLGTEPGACEVLIDSAMRRKVDMGKLHFHQLTLAAPPWSAIKSNIEAVQHMNFESLSKVSDIAKKEMKHFMELADWCNSFKDDKDGRDYGDVMNFGADRALVIDSLSGLNKMAREYTVGYRPQMHVGEWGVAMQLEENFLYRLVANRKCFFVLVAHVDREVDEVFGGTKLTLAALGRKLAPQLVKFFSDVIYAKREGKNFFWSTEEANVDVKARSVPISSKLSPSFGQIVETYKRRLAATAPAASVVPIPAQG
jgi:hypothetical protein